MLGVALSEIFGARWSGRGKGKGWWWSDVVGRYVFYFEEGERGRVVVRLFGALDALECAVMLQSGVARGEVEFPPNI